MIWLPYLLFFFLLGRSQVYTVTGAGYTGAGGGARV